MGMPPPFYALPQGAAALHIVHEAREEEPVPVELAQEKGADHRAQGRSQGNATAVVPEESSALGRAPEVLPEAGQDAAVSTTHARRSSNR